MRADSSAAERFLKLRLITRQFFQVLLRGAQARRSGSVALIQQIEGADGRAVNFLGIGQDALLGFELRVFLRICARLQMRLFDLAALEGPQVEDPHAVLLVLFEFGDAPANLLPVGERGGYVLQLDSRVSIEQVLPRRGIEVHDGFILCVDHRQVGRNLLQHRHGRRLIVDEDPSLAAGSNLAPQNQRAVLRIQAIGLEDPFDGTRRNPVALEHGRNHRPFRTRADHIRGRFFSQQQPQRVNQNGLPRPSLPGQKIQTSREFDRDIVDDRVIFQSKFGQHKDPILI